MADERKKIFIDTVEGLFTAYPLSVPTEAYEFFDDYKKSGTQTKLFTDKGIAVIQEMREIDDWISAKSLGERMDLSGRSVSGTMRKLVTDGYIEKKAGSPAMYKITEKGKICELKAEVDN